MSQTKDQMGQVTRRNFLTGTAGLALALVSMPRLLRDDIIKEFGIDRREFLTVPPESLFDIPPLKVFDPLREFRAYAPPGDMPTRIDLMSKGSTLYSVWVPPDNVMLWEPRMQVVIEEPAVVWTGPIGWAVLVGPDGVVMSVGGS